MVCKPGCIFRTGVHEKFSSCVGTVTDISRYAVSLGLLLFVVFALTSGVSRANGVFGESANKLDRFTIEYLYDENGSQGIEQIAKEPFAREISNQFALGYKEGVAWFKIAIKNNSAESRFVLYFTEPFWSSLDLYAYQDKQWRQHKNGLAVPVNARDIRDANPAFPVNIPPGKTAIFYVRGETVSSHIGEFQLFTHDEFFKPSRISITDAYILYSGVLFFVMLFVGFLYFKMREVIYLYYIGYVSSFVAWIAVQSGFYLYAGIPGWNEGLHAVGTLLVAFLVMFSRLLLRLSDRAPVTGRIFDFAAIFFLGCGLAITLRTPYVNLIFNISSSLFFMLLLITSVRAWLGKYFTNARFYLIALMLYMPTMGLMTLTYNGLLPNVDLTRYSFIFGSFIEIMFFSFVLVSRYHNVNNDRIRMQQELIHEKEQRSAYLEREVEERTKELVGMNKELLQKTRELEEAKAQLTRDATTDMLSGLFNRRYFLGRFAALFEEARSQKHAISLIMIDIDRFKSINDTYGHEIGDVVIRACGDIFREYARNTDIVSRYGGEEFAILMPRSAYDDALLLAERIRTQVENRAVGSKDNVAIRITLSIGVTQIDLGRDTCVEDMLQRADKALYAAKKKGRNKVVGL